jgi:hypothetical protein
MMKRRHLLLGSGGLVAASIIGQFCQSTPRPDEPEVEEPTALATIDPSVQPTMGELVTAFLQTLEPDQQSQAIFPYDSEERLNWHYTPRSRQGIAFKEMSAEQRQACDGLLQFTLSETGYQKYQGAISSVPTING